MDDLSSLLLAAIEGTEQWALAALEELPPPDLTPRIQGDYVAWIVHAGRHDPSSVLGRCAADRRTVEEWMKQVENPFNGLSHEPPYFIRNLAEGYGLSDHQGGA